MFDLKVINSVLNELETERGVSREKVLEAIEFALASAYKKEYGKKGQIVKAKFDLNSGGVDFVQSKIIVDRKNVIMEDVENEENSDISSHSDEFSSKVRFNPEHHILIEDARLIKKDA